MMYVASVLHSHVCTCKKNKYTLLRSLNSISVIHSLHILIPYFNFTIPATRNQTTGTQGMPFQTHQWTIGVTLQYF